MCTVRLIGVRILGCEETATGELLQRPSLEVAQVLLDDFRGVSIPHVVPL